VAIRKGDDGKACGATVEATDSQGTTRTFDITADAVVNAGGVWSDEVRLLPAREFRSGYAEIAKYGLLGDAAFFKWLRDYRTANTGKIATLNDLWQSLSPEDYTKIAAIRDIAAKTLDGTVPTSRAKLFTTSRDNQTAVCHSISE
jgi:hypothetical protein